MEEIRAVVGCRHPRQEGGHDAARAGSDPQRVWTAGESRRQGRIHETLAARRRVAFHSVIGSAMRATSSISERRKAEVSALDESEALWPAHIWRRSGRPAASAAAVTCLTRTRWSG